MTEMIRIRKMQETDLDFLDLVSGFDSVEDVLTHTRTCLCDLGLDMISYHFAPPFHSQTAEEVTVFTHGFHEDWTQQYQDPKFRERDPIPDYVMDKHRPVSWQRALKEHPDRPRANAFRKEMKANGLIHGIGVPLFGPGGRDAYSSCSIGRPFTPSDRKFVRRLRMIAQSAHLRISHLVLEQINKGVELSMRETEVLSWVIAGKSRKDVATILEISSATVDTYLRRIFAKLHVNDRIRASLSALSRGLIKL